MLITEAPGILVSMPALKDSYFEKTVILLCSYDHEGAFGLVMNHPSNALVKDFLSEDIKENDVFNIPILVGGPVQPDSFWAVHTSDFSVEETTVISPNINLSSAQDLLVPLSKGQVVESYQFGSGYAGWSAGQLDREIQEESWWLGPLDENILFETEFAILMKKIRASNRN